MASTALAGKAVGRALARQQPGQAFMRLGLSCPSGAFTLVEILVVIAILGILASILFPVFTRARDKGRQACCTSNLKQLATALHCYANDHDEMFPLDSDFGPGCFWFERIQPYVRNEQIGVCPQKDFAPRIPPGADHPYPATYAMNAVMCRVDMFGGNTLFDLARIQYTCDVAAMFMIGEAVRDIAPPQWFYPAWWPYVEYHDFLHNGQANVAFVDGHVKSLGPGASFTEYPGLLK